MLLFLKIPLWRFREFPREGARLFLSKTVLVVDDEHNALVALAKILREDGYNVVVAANEEQALHRLSKDRFDLVITDLFLLHNCCVKLLNKIKNLKYHIPIILTTAHGNVEQYIDKSSLKSMKQLTKPIKYDELKRIIGTIEAEREEYDSGETGTEPEKTSEAIDLKG